MTITVMEESGSNLVPRVAHRGARGEEPACGGPEAADALRAGQLGSWAVRAPASTRRSGDRHRGSRSSGAGTASAGPPVPPVTSTGHLRSVCPPGVQPRGDRAGSPRPRTAPGSCHTLPAWPFRLTGTLSHVPGAEDGSDPLAGDSRRGPEGGGRRAGRGVLGPSAATLPPASACTAPPRPTSMATPECTALPAPCPPAPSPLPGPAHQVPTAAAAGDALGRFPARRRATGTRGGARTPEAGRATERRVPVAGNRARVPGAP